MSKLKQKYGFWTALALTLTGTLGSSLIISFNQVAILTNNSAIFLMLAWVLGGLAIIPENLIMIEPAVSFKESGTAYAWVRRAGWKALGFWFGWMLVIMVAAGAVALVSLSLGNLIWTLIDQNQNLLNPTATKWTAKSIGVAILFVLAAIHIFVRNSNKYTQHLFTFLTMLPIGFILLLACIYGNLANGVNNETQQTINKDLSSLFVSSGLLVPAIMLTSYAYSGTEISTYITGEIKKPEKTIPKVMIFGIIAIILIYVLYGFALLSLTSSMAELDDIPLKLSIPTWAKLTFQIMAIFLFVGSLNAFLVYHTALVFKLSEEGDLSHHFNKVNKNNVPYMAMLLLLAIAMIHILTNDLFDIVTYFTLATSALKIIMVTASLYLRLKDKEYKKIWSNSIFYMVLFFAYFTCLMTFVGAILALFAFYPREKATSELIIQISFLIVMIGLIPIGYLKYYLQNYFESKTLIRQQLNLPTNRELKVLYFDDKPTYLAIKRKYKQLVNKTYQNYLIEKKNYKKSGN